MELLHFTKNWLCKATVTAVVLASLPLMGNAQSENPRGIYKMTTLIGKRGEVEAPSDQYKICTDSVTLTVIIAGPMVMIMKNDKDVFNYTGEHPKAKDDTSSLIYDSNAEHFTLKWWSTSPAHLHFPMNDWCIEKYEANKFSEMGKIVFDALNGNVEPDSLNPLIGTWRLRADGVDESELEKVLQELLQHPDRELNYFMVFTPDNMTMMNQSRGIVSRMNYEEGNAFTKRMNWLSKDQFAFEQCEGMWQIFERITDGSSPLIRIVKMYGHMK